MTPNDDIRELAGRYATGSLSEAERTRLFEAALDDQELYDELAQEQEMKQLLDEPGARDRMIRALEPPPKRKSFWVWGLVPVTILSAFAIVYVTRPAKQPPPVEVAMQKPSSAPAPAISEPQPVASPAAPSPAVASPGVPREVAADKPPAPPPVSSPISGDAVEKDSKRGDAEAAASTAPKGAAKKEEAEARDEIKAAAEAAPVEKAKVVAGKTQPEDARRKQADAKEARPAPALSSRAIQRKADTLYSPPASQAGQTQQQNSPGGPRQNVNQAAASTGLVDEQKAGLGFHYSLETKGHLTIVPAVDGFLAVKADDGTVMYASKRTAAGILIDLPLPAGASSVSITFSRGATPVQPASSARSEVFGAVQGPGDLAVAVKLQP